MAKLVDALGLGPSGAICIGSSPIIPTKVLRPCSIMTIQLPCKHQNVV